MNIQTPIWPLMAILLGLGSFHNLFVMCKGKATGVNQMALTVQPSDVLPAVVIVFLSMTITKYVAYKLDWSYSGANGPSTWKNKYPDCGKNAQSPIDLKPEKSDEVEIKADSIFQVSGYNNVRGKCVMKNDGLHGHVEMGGSEWKIRGGIFKNNSYVLKEFHFHWGEDKTGGSEHMINGERFPLEMHLVHHLEQKSTTPNDVKKVAVLGVLFRGACPQHKHIYTLNIAAVLKGEVLQEGKEDNFLYKSVIDGLGRTIYKDQDTILASFRLRDMLPYDMNSYYSYNGSFTTPPCTESVHWIVFNDTITLSPKQVDAFRKLRALKKDEANADSTSMTNCFRPVQPIGDRTVYAVRAETITKSETDETNEVANEMLREKEVPGDVVHKKRAAGETNTGSVALVVALMLCQLFA